ncbi:hypothetical protein K525DRAFT_151541, partial [Schizophyllum commune Loenen D]
MLFPTLPARGFALLLNMQSLQNSNHRVRTDTLLLARHKTSRTMDPENLTQFRARCRESAIYGGRTRVAGMNAFYASYLPQWERITTTKWATLHRALIRNGTITKSGTWARLPRPNKKTRTQNEDDKCR